MKIILAIIMSLSFAAAQAQFDLTLIVTDSSAGEPQDVYVAGSFNNWQQNDASHKLTKQADGTYAITLHNVPAGKPEYKFMHGTWEKVETTATGDDVANHELTLSGNYKTNAIIKGWKDGKPQQRKHTASANVHIIDTAFFIPQLNRYRRIWIYLPENYASSKQKYPVLYMHDGQNLFDAYTAPFGEWGVDECLDTLQKQLNKYAIVVGIDHGNDKRLTEYNFYDNTRFGKGEGKLYAAFLEKTLKPWIDAHYRTKPEAKYTAVAGSSLGGLVSHSIILDAPNVFGAAGIFSPSYWIAPKIYDDAAKALSLKQHLNFFFYCGGKEGDSMQSDMERMMKLLMQNRHFSAKENFAPDAKHNEGAWHVAFADFYRFWVGKW
jgi:predicted alpha/beta superfamily hydrolase